MRCDKNNIIRKQMFYWDIMIIENYLPSFRVAVVFIETTSDPLLGSDMLNAPTHSPVQSLGRKRFFYCWLPCLTI
jgi:hypothetical protein